jgi:lytic murein transglycosylase
MHRRDFIVLATAALAGPSMAGAPAQPASDLLGAAGDPAFIAWLNGFYARQLAAGWSSAALAQTLSGLSPDPRVLAHNASQPEFALPISTYVQRNLTPGVIALGRRKRDAVAELPKIEAGSGVPAAILTAIWAMETGFGVNQGDMDVVRSLATIAAEYPPRTAWAETELEACVKIVASGAAARSQLRGSWAGAMGQTQLLPSAFLSAAVAAQAGAKPDIWGSSADALASAASLLVKGGWRRGESWAREVKLASGFDLSLTEGPKQPPPWWEAKGAHRADGQPWSAADATADAQLIVPCGAAGPAFLAFPNHFVIRTYNNALAYALTVGLIADRIAGGAALAAAWPIETPLSLEDRMDCQAALAKLGYNPGAPDGLIGVSTRAALRAWQKDHGLPADGYLSPAMVQRLRAAAKAGA